MSKVMEERAVSCTLLAQEVGVKEKSGTLFTSTVHILTAMVGAGVLALPQAIGNLGWVAGLGCLVFFYFVSVLAANLLASCFEVNGKQHPRYYEAVAQILGRKAEIGAALCQLLNILLVCIAYVITASISMTSIADMACGLPVTTDQSDDDGCWNEKWKFQIIFGAAQILFVQLPNIEESWIVSTMGAATAIGYSTIALGLCIAKVAEGNHYGTVGGINTGSSADKAFNILNALGTVGFAYTISQILLEVQDTLREPPKAEVTMKKSCKVGLTIGLAFYMSVAIFGYLGLGSAVPSDVLTAFENPKWLLMLAHALVVLHMSAAYNVFAQTFFLTLEGYIQRITGIRHPAEDAAIKAAAAALSTGGPSAGHLGTVSEEGVATFVKEDATKSDLAGGYSQLTAGMSGAVSGMTTATSAGFASAASKDGMLDPRSPSVIHATATFRGASAASLALDRHASVHSIAGPYRMRTGLRCVQEDTKKRSWKGIALSVAVRTMYVVVTTAVAVIVPFFSEITGLIGSLIFFPLVIYFPFTMYIAAYKPTGNKLLGLKVLMAFMLLVAIGATIGSVRNIVSQWSTFEVV